MIENKDPRITVLYNGVYSDRLNWKTDRMAEFANRSDLRTYVYIVTGEEMDRPQITSLGDILAWRNLLSAANPFSRPLELGKSSEVFHTTTEGRADASIIINHQILLDRVKQQNDGRVTPESYAGLLDKEVHSGFRRILMEEKGDLFKYTGRFAALFATGLALTPLIAHYQLEGIHMIDLGNTEGVIEAIYRFVEAECRLADKIAIPLSIGAGIYRLWQQQNVIKNDPGQYVQSLRDMNPLKYIADTYRGLTYLAARNKPLVELEH